MWGFSMIKKVREKGDKRTQSGVLSWHTVYELALFYLEFWGETIKIYWNVILKFFFRDELKL